MHAIAIHGGAGAMPRHSVSTERAQQYRASLGLALDAGFTILDRGGTSLDAVTAAVRLLEDDPLFNAGRGAALTRDGWAELDAAVMLGAAQKAGAVAAVRHVKNPVDLARRVMEKSRHVLLVGAGAEEFALEEGLRIGTQPAACAPTSGCVSSLHEQQGVSGFRPRADAARHGRRRGARRERRSRCSHVHRRHDQQALRAGRRLAHHRRRHLRAKNGVCAVSATGHGEYFIRAVAAYHICCAVEYRGLSLAEAAHETVHKNIRALGGTGGVIGVDAHGGIVMEFSTAAMFRGARDARGRREIAIYRRAG